MKLTRVDRLCRLGERVSQHVAYRTRERAFCDVVQEWNRNCNESVQETWRPTIQETLEGVHVM